MTIDAMPDAVLVDEERVHASCAPGPNVLPGTRSCGTKEPQASESPLVNELRSDDCIHLLIESSPRSGRDIVRAASAHTFAGEVAIASNDTEDAQRSKFSSTAKRIAFLVVYMVVFSSALSASFSTMREGRDAEPTISPVQSDVSIKAEAVTIRNPAEDHLEVVSEPLIQNQRVGSADFSHAPEPSLLAEPDSALSSPVQKIEVGGQNADFASWPEAEASQESEPGHPDGVVQLIEQLDHQVAETSDPAHEPIPLIEQSPAAAPAGSAETAPHSDAAQSDAGNSLDATPKDAAKATATVPTGNASAALSSREHAVKRRKVNVLRQYAQPSQRVRQQTLERYLQPVHYGQQPGSYYTDSNRRYGDGQQPGSYYTDSNRGYGYVGPAPH